MRCPRCGSTGTVHVSTIAALALHVRRCDDCTSQFTVPARRDDASAHAARVLILNVEDRPQALYARNRMLKANGFAVADAATGRAALEIALTMRPRVILLDVHLPDADGRELCRQMRATEALRGIPVVLISATLSTHETPDLAACGAAAYLREPVAADVLAATLRRALTDAGAS